ncbi:hypothetical protein Tco_1067126 [Tanacetum coccineum]|uniref:Uncharacterized protein n=1 Tax=Tanacetum coccineum TaxID=301880 RepID=A0ABQ5HD93_9ASTR
MLELHVATVSIDEAICEVSRCLPYVGMCGYMIRYNLIRTSQMAYFETKVYPADPAHIPKDILKLSEQRVPMLPTVASHSVKSYVPSLLKKSIYAPQLMMMMTCCNDEDCLKKLTLDENKMDG